MKLPRSQLTIFEQVIDNEIDTEEPQNDEIECQGKKIEEQGNGSSQKRKKKKKRERNQGNEIEGKMVNIIFFKLKMALYTNSNTLRTSIRSIKPPQRLNNFVNYHISTCPIQDHLSYHNTTPNFRTIRILLFVATN